MKTLQREDIELLSFRGRINQRFGIQEFTILGTAQAEGGQDKKESPDPLRMRRKDLSLPWLKESPSSNALAGDDTYRKETTVKE